MTGTLAGPTFCDGPGGAVSGPFEIRPIGTVRSPLRDRGSAPLQADEGAPGAWLEFDASVGEALKDLRSRRPGPSAHVA